ncbi:MAG: TetR/AcrR family transcriptional regulator [Defluviicoccus sp.]|nr:TetR/AcrR family transcriptional regulator [Defluviicoccus sp.]MDE0384059.1 TetR/AcrR family transcriptional regulator [Defluviicoccus sp.]
MKEISRAARRDRILDVAVETLAERGYRRTTMLEVARRASASKETLYAWFGSKPRLFEAVILRNADSVRSVVEGHLNGDAPVEAALADFGRALAGLLLGESAVAINRAAISEARTAPELGRILSQSGREATLPVFVRYLERRRSDGALAFDDAVQAAEAYIGLLLGDAQVRRLLGVMPPPGNAELEGRARLASQMFLLIYGA